MQLEDSEPVVKINKQFSFLDGGKIRYVNFTRL
jgi:hypothetical protein